MDAGADQVGTDGGGGEVGIVDCGNGPFTGVEIDDGICVFRSGTKKDGDTLVTSGGRVLAVTGMGQNLKAAIERTYRAVDGIKFEGMHYRKDIGQRAAGPK